MELIVYSVIFGAQSALKFPIIAQLASQLALMHHFYFPIIFLVRSNAQSGCMEILLTESAILVMLPVSVANLFQPIVMSARQAWATHGWDTLVTVPVQ